MKTTEKIKNPFEQTVQMNPELDKYKDTIWFPEKLALAKKMLANTKLPERVRHDKQVSDSNMNEK